MATTTTTVVGQNKLIQGDDAMNKPMTPSEVKITDGQIGKAAEVLSAALRKHRGEFKSNIAQQVLGVPELAKDLIAVWRNYYEKFSNMITRIVKVELKRTPEQAIAATKRNKYFDDKVVEAMPRAKNGEAQVVFFKIGHTVTDEELEVEYASRNLRPADPFTLAAVNEADPAFADEHPNSTHWKDAHGKWCYIAFYRWRDGRRVNVARDDDDWDDDWWFAGLAS